MPDLRIVTWNSTGEGDGQGQVLANTVTNINATYAAGSVPVQIVAIQEAAVYPGSICAAFGQAPFAQFVQPPGFCREQLPPPAQPYRVGISRAYRLSWLTSDHNYAFNIDTQAADPALVNLDPAYDAGVDDYLSNLPVGSRAKADIVVAAGNIRWPIYMEFAYHGTTVHFFSWHAPLRYQWLGATYANISLQGPALAEAFLFFQHSSFYTNIMRNLSTNDLVIIAGDFNMQQKDLQQREMFPQFVGVSEGLDHILAYSRSRHLAMGENAAYDTPYGPHAILTARIHW